jgi:uncharacterized protein (TIGR02001 family)
MRVLTRRLLAASFVASTLSVPAAEEEHGATGGLGIYSQYVFRGLSETGEKPALQGSIEYFDQSGFYIGGAANNISVISDTAQSEGTGPVSVSLKLEIALGHKAKITEDWNYDIGLVRYQFPGTYPSDFVKPHTTELYGQIGWKWITLKLSNSLGSKTFGINNSKNSYYADLTAALPINEYLTLTLHAGKQKFKGETSGVSNEESSYNDYKAELAWAFIKDWDAGFAFTHTNAKDDAYTVLEKNIGKKQIYGFVKKKF